MKKNQKNEQSFNRMFKFLASFGRLTGVVLVPGKSDLLGLRQ